MVAVRSGHYRMVKYLVSRKDKSLLEKADYSGWNALHHTVMPYRLNRRFDLIEALVGAGVPLNEVRIHRLESSYVQLCEPPCIIQLGRGCNFVCNALCYLHSVSFLQDSDE